MYGANLLEAPLLRIVIIALLSLSLAACSGHRIWPFGKKAPQTPETSSVLVFEGGENIPQYWQRNAVVIDLQGVAGAGHLAAKLAAGHSWPPRIKLRVRAGSFGELEVRGAQRIILPNPPDRTELIELDLPPAVYRHDTPQLDISWRSRQLPAEDLPAPGS
ncbi:MAG: hypothetical protein R3E72_05535 [Steroidobacteraceae bacterium]|jgi:hypothetical protein